MKDKNHIIDLNKCGKHLARFNTFMIKPLNKVGTKGMYSDVIKDISDKPTANIVLNGEKLKTALSNQGNKTKLFVHDTNPTCSIVLEVLVKATGH